MSPLLLVVLPLSSASFAQDAPAIADDKVWEFFVDLAAVAPVSSQAQVKQGAYETVSGTVSGACAGLVRVNAIAVHMPGAGDKVPEGQEVEKPEPIGPVTSLERSGSGAFSMAIPSGKDVMLTALCDRDEDGIVDSSGSDLASPSYPVGILDGNVDGIDLGLVGGGVAVNSLGNNTGADNDGKRPDPDGEPSGPREPGGEPPDELPPPE